MVTVQLRTRQFELETGGRGLNDTHPWGFDGGDKELRAVGVLARVGHGENAGLVVLDIKVFICKTRQL